MTAAGEDTRFDAFGMARRSASLAGRLDARALANVADELAPGDQAVVVDWAISGRTSADGRPALRVSVNGSVPLVCQRCLGPLEWRVAQDTEVLLAADERELGALDEESESEVVLADRPLRVADLVEDELVLSLPFAPRHEGACPARG